MSASDVEFHPDDFEGLTPKQTSIHPAELRKLRKAADGAAALQARLDELERREHFARAGVPLDHPAAPYFITGYKGDLDPEAIKSAAIQAAMPWVDPNAPTQEEVRQHQAVQSAAAGASPPNAAQDIAAKLAEMSQKQFAPSDDVGRQNHINEIMRLARDNNLRIPLQ